VLSASLMALNSAFWRRFAYRYAAVVIKLIPDINSPSGKNCLHTSSINCVVSRLTCILYIILCCTDHVLGTDTCVTNMCTESSGTIAVFLTDTTPGCSGNADNYLVSKCGVGYSGTTCDIDCGSIYSWSGSYWEAQGCSILGNLCGAQGECDSSVSNVCLEAPPPTPSPAPSPTSSSKHLPAGAIVGGVCSFIVVCILIIGCIHLGGGGDGGGGGGGGGGSTFNPLEHEGHVRGGGGHNNHDDWPSTTYPQQPWHPNFPFKRDDTMPLKPLDQR